MLLGLISVLCKYLHSSKGELLVWYHIFILTKQGNAWLFSELKIVLAYSFQAFPHWSDFLMLWLKDNRGVKNKKEVQVKKICCAAAPFGLRRGILGSEDDEALN